MRTPLLRFVGVCAIAVLTTFSAYGARDPSFEKANEDFREGRFEEAVDDYQKLLQSGYQNAALFYDLGNAWFRLGDLGKAILNYERALALDPRHPEAKANLQLARDEARALDLEKTRLERFISFGTSSQYAVIASIAFWLTLLVAARLYFLRQRSVGLIALIVLLCSLSAGAISAAYIAETGSNGSALAIVTGKNVEARLATADNSKGVLSLPSGSQVKILNKRGDWTYAELPNGLRGWVPSTSAERVRL